MFKDVGKSLVLEQVLQLRYFEIEGSKMNGGIVRYSRIKCCSVRLMAIICLMCCSSCSTELFKPVQLGL
jgi:hypothetical protein